jgi:hypothetical protein
MRLEGALEYTASCRSSSTSGSEGAAEGAPEGALTAVGGGSAIVAGCGSPGVHATLPSASVASEARAARALARLGLCGGFFDIGGGD